MNEQNANQSLAQPEISVIVPVYKVERFSAGVHRLAFGADLYGL